MNERYPDCNGVYILQSKKVNDTPYYWLQENGQNAIWWQMEYNRGREWVIGSKKFIGKNEKYCKMNSTKNAPGPQEVDEWAVWSEE